jgi:hypothetical protein
MAIRWQNLRLSHTAYKRDPLEHIEKDQPVRVFKYKYRPRPLHIAAIYVTRLNDAPPGRSRYRKWTRLIRWKYLRWDACLTWIYHACSSQSFWHEICLHLWYARITAKIPVHGRSDVYYIHQRCNSKPDPPEHLYWRLRIHVFHYII